MYHSIYPTCFVGNQIPKSQLLVTYGDLPLFTLDHLSAFLPVVQPQPLYMPQQLAFDVPRMKRIPVSLLMQGVDAMNCYLPMIRKPYVNPKNNATTNLERQFSKESLIESACSWDSGMPSSRSSTPSSDAMAQGSAEESADFLGSHSPILPTKRVRRNSERHASNKFQQCNLQNNQKLSQTGGKNVNSPSSHIPHLVKDEWTSLSQGIWGHYIATKQREDTFWKKMNLRSAVHAVLNQIFPNCGLWVVGSSVNGLGTNTSDADMCLILSIMEIDQQTEAMQLLRHAQRLLNLCSFVRSTELITAKVPILKLTDKYNIQVDLNINNTVGIANTQLLRAYSNLDWRVPALVVVIKKWAQDCNINNAKEMTLSSYSLVLMVIHYLQCGCSPVVLPCLQKMYPRRQDTGSYWKFPIPHNDSCNFRSKNTESLGSLLYGFFDYFTNHFDFEKDVMSIRLGCKLPKPVAMNYRSAKNKRGHWKFICIEEPFNRTNTACAVYDQDSFNRIMCAFKGTLLQLGEKKNLSVVLKS